MKRIAKLLHTVSAIGLAGGLAAYMLIVSQAPESAPLEVVAARRHDLALISRWLILPSMVGVVLSGLLALFANHALIDATWVWVKAVSGVLLFQATLGGVDGPAQRASAASALAVAGEIDAATLADRIHDQWLVWWIILLLAVGNVVLAIWRPRFRRRRREPTA